MKPSEQSDETSSVKESSERGTWFSKVAESSTRPKRRVICTVCGDGATGYNFGAIVCESCKSFYRRHAHRRPNFRCPAFGKCEINKLNRRRCAACRLRKCFAMGMRVPPTVDDGGFRKGWTAERLHQRSLLISRLQQRLATRVCSTSGESDSGSESGKENTTALLASAKQLQSESSLASDEGSTCSSNEEELQHRVAMAAKLMPVGSEMHFPARQGTSPSPQDTFVQLALGNYVTALKLFPELTQLDSRTLRWIFERQMMAQMNLYAMFSVSEDLQSWSAVDRQGVACQLRFDDFVQSSDDQVDAQRYVDAFCCLVALVRDKFQRDWPSVLMVLGLLNLVSADVNSDVRLAELTGLRDVYQSYLKTFLSRRFAVSSESLHRFCMQQFPEALERLVQVHESVLSKQFAPLSRVAQRTSSPWRSVGRDPNSLKRLFEPLVSSVVSHMTCSWS